MSTEALIGADFKTPPYLHQLREFEISADLPGRALLWNMRTGKSKLTIDTFSHQAVEGKIEAAIVLAPNGVHRNWLERELPIHHWDTLPYRALAWNTAIAGKSAAYKSKANRLLEEEFWEDVEQNLKWNEGLSWWSFSTETVTRKDVRNLVARVLRRKKSVALVIDESDDYGKPGSKRTKMVWALANKCRTRRILSGTSVENSPLRAYAQFKMLQSEKALGFGKYGDFEKHFAVYEQETRRNGQTYMQLTGFQNLDELKRSMASWSSVVLREDCEDMPALVRTPRCFELSEQQRRASREVKEELRAMLDTGEVVTLTDLSPKLIKLQQISSGYLVDEFGVHHDIPGPNPRLEATMDEVELTGGNCVVWCAFRPDMDLVAGEARARGFNVLEYHGRTSDKDKEIATVAAALAVILFQSSTH